MTTTPGRVEGTGRIVICGAGVVGAAIAHALTERGERATIVDRGEPASAASGSASGFLALDWNDGTPLDAMSRASFALHRELAATLGPERYWYRPLDVLTTAAADEEDVERYRRHPSPAWLDGNVVTHQIAGTIETTAQLDPRAFTAALVDAAIGRGATLVRGVIDGLTFGPSGRVSGLAVAGETIPADTVVLALGPWTVQAQRWLALPQVFATRLASAVLAADVPAQAIFSDFLAADGSQMPFRIYPRPNGTVYVTGRREHDALPDDPADIRPSDAAIGDLRRIAGVHASCLRDAELVATTACYRPITIDGMPLIGPLTGRPGVILATAHGSWGVLNAPATGRMVAEIILDGRSHSLDATPFTPARLPAARL